MTAAERERGIALLRVDQPRICLRPNEEFRSACLLDLGHTGPCGWETPTGAVGPLFEAAPAGVCTAVRVTNSCGTHLCRLPAGHPGVHCDNDYIWTDA